MSWNTWGGSVCCSTCSNCCGWLQTATARLKCSTPDSTSPAKAAFTKQILQTDSRVLLSSSLKFNSKRCLNAVVCVLCIHGNHSTKAIASSVLSSSQSQALCSMQRFFAMQSLIPDHLSCTGNRMGKRDRLTLSEQLLAQLYLLQEEALHRLRVLQVRQLKIKHDCMGCATSVTRSFVVSITKCTDLTVFVRLRYLLTLTFTPISVSSEC